MHFQIPEDTNIISPIVNLFVLKFFSSLTFLFPLLSHPKKRLPYFLCPYDWLTNHNFINFKFLKSHTDT